MLPKKPGSITEKTRDKQARGKRRQQLPYGCSKVSLCPLDTNNPFCFKVFRKPRACPTNSFNKAILKGNRSYYSYL